MKKIVSTEDMYYEDCLRWRKTGIGGSDATVIWGINPFKSILDLWREELEDIRENKEETLL